MALASHKALVTVQYRKVNPRLFLLLHLGKKDTIDIIQESVLPRASEGKTKSSFSALVNNHYSKETCMHA